MDRLSGNARVQVPSDCVNALAVGATNDIGEGWARASYSAIGPGRSPGVVKPDLMAFGGDGDKYFHVLSPGKTPSLAPQRGTSFASPYLLRNAVGIRAILGAALSPLAIKALLDQGWQGQCRNERVLRDEEIRYRGGKQIRPGKMGNGSTRRKEDAWKQS
ncbi:MAG: S8 family serine peptidase [Azoarcus sp.]|nr:S8 family serine peptidase [Azoarcus sp.]